MSEQTNIYKEASKINLSTKLPGIAGLTSFIDFWNIDLAILDAKYTELSAELDGTGKTSLLNPKPVDKTKNLLLAIIIDVVQTQQEEAKARKERQAEYQQRQARRQFLLQAREAKQADQVMEMSLEEIDAQLAELD